MEKGDRFRLRMHISRRSRIGFLRQELFEWVVNAPQMSAPRWYISYMLTVATLIGITIGSTVSVNVTAYCLYIVT